MTRKFNFLYTLSLMLLVSTMAVAQPNATTITSEDGIMQSTEVNAGKYPVKPKSMWELGINGGHSMVTGDVYPKLPAGFAVGLHVRKSLNYVLSIRAGYNYHSTSGLNHYQGSIADEGNPALLPLIAAGKTKHVLAYKTAINDFNAELVVNLSNLKFHKSTSKWGFYAAAGFGFVTHNTDLDMLKDDGTPHDWSSISGINRGDNLESVKGILDGTYETDSYTNDDLSGTSAGTYFSVAPGVSYKINKQINISLEQKLMFTNAELLDGSAKYGTNNFVNDVISYTNLRVNFNLGNPKKQVEPLYWLNPLDAPYDMIANNTERLDNLGDLLADKDGDGVPDKLDKEQNTPAGAIVNTKGETLDSDADGVPDYLDKQPFTEPGEAVNGEGKSTKVQPDYVVKNDLDAIAKQKNWVNVPQKAVPNKAAGVTSWFLPMIHFDNSSSSIKPTYYPQLDHVATVLKKNPSLNVVVEGHASSTSSVGVNNRLSYKRAKAAIDFLVSNYGISASRLTLRYAGEASPLSGSNGNNFMNRRVEFSVNDGSVSSMGAPGN
ncbi:MAG: OmpA family protein [Saprospiraceae bacterium]